MYKSFFRLLIDSGISLELVRSKVYLTDEGKAIQSALLEFGCVRHSCYRHLIEKMGSATILGIFTRRLLFTSTQVSYEATLKETLLELQKLMNKQLITKKQLHKICNIFNLTIAKNGQIQSENYDHRNALWHRAQEGIATCSNHIERLHRTLNDAVTQIQSFSPRFSEVIEIILDWPDKFLVNQHRQEKLVLKTLRRKAREAGTEQTDHCHSELCGLSEFYSHLFGIDDFPCIHTITQKSPTFMVIPFPSFVSSPNHVVTFVVESRNSVSYQNSAQIEPLRNDVEEIGNDSQTDFAFLLQTASELKIMNPVKFMSRDRATIFVADCWGRFRRELDSITMVYENELERTDDETRAEFRSNLLIQMNIIGKE
jgi:uncharacterized protein YlxP (DUF503 family)